MNSISIIIPCMNEWMNECIRYWIAVRTGQWACVCRRSSRFPSSFRSPPTWTASRRSPWLSTREMQIGQGADTDTPPPLRAADSRLIIAGGDCLSLYVCMYVWVYVCMYVRVYVCIRMYLLVKVFVILHVYMYVCLYVFMCVCMHACF